MSPVKKAFIVQQIAWAPGRGGVVNIKKHTAVVLFFLSSMFYIESFFFLLSHHSWQAALRVKCPAFQLLFFVVHGRCFCGEVTVQGQTQHMPEQRTNRNLCNYDSLLCSPKAAWVTFFLPTLQRTSSVSRAQTKDQCPVLNAGLCWV